VYQRTDSALGIAMRAAGAGCFGKNFGDHRAMPQRGNLVARARTRGAAMFDLDGFVAECRAALAADCPPALVRELVARTASDPVAVIERLGEPKQAGVQKLYHAGDLTILNIAWGPTMTVAPHNHRMWAVIGIYGGREDNIFWRRRLDAGNRLEAVGARALSVGEAETLDDDVIHSVTNPIARLTGAIHVYGGDFFAAERSEWDPETLTEGRYDADRMMRRFEQANGRIGGDRQ